MAFTCTWTDPQPAHNGRDFTGEEKEGVALPLRRKGVVYRSVGLTFQVRIPSKSDKAGGSPIRQTAKEVRPSLLLLILLITFF